MATRRVGVVLTSIGMQSVGLVAYVIVLAALGRWPTFEWELVPYAALLSVIGIVSLAALYRAFAIGPIAVVSPVVASYAALTVILIVIFLGERLTMGQIIAIGVTFIGVAVASTDIRELRRTLGRPTEGVRIGFFATLGFAVWSAIFAVAVRETDGLALIVVQRAFSVVASRDLRRRATYVAPSAPRPSRTWPDRDRRRPRHQRERAPGSRDRVRLRVVRDDRQRRVPADPGAARDRRPATSASRRISTSVWRCWSRGSSRWAYRARRDLAGTRSRPAAAGRRGP